MRDATFEEQEIDLIDLFWYILEQWKGWIAAGLIFAVLLSGVMFVKSGTQVVAAEEGAENLDSDASIAYATSLSALEGYANYKLMSQANSNHLFLKINLMDCKKVNYIFQVLPEGNDKAQPLDYAYSAILSDSAFTGALADKIDKTADPASLADLCSLDGGSNSSDANAPRSLVYTFSANIPNSISDSDWAEAVGAALSTYRDKVAATCGAHGLKLIVVNSAPANTTELLKAMNGRISDINSAKSTYKSAYDSLSDEDKAIVAQIINADEASLSSTTFRMQKDLDAAWKEAGREIPNALADAAKAAADAAGAGVSGTGDEPQVISVPRHFSVKYLALGFILGVFLYCGGVMLYIMFKRVVRREDELEHATGIRNFGAVYQYPYTGLLALLHDRRIYNRRRGISSGAAKAGSSKLEAGMAAYDAACGNEALAEMDTIARNLSSMLSYRESSDITFITLGTPNDTATTIRDSQIDSLMASGLNVSTVLIEGGLEAVPDSVFTDMKAAFLVLLSGTTNWKDIAELAKRLRQYNIEILGSEFIEAA